MAQAPPRVPFSWNSLPLELRARIAGLTASDFDAARLHLADMSLFRQPRDGMDALFLECLGRLLTRVQQGPDHYGSTKVLDLIDDQRTDTIAFMVSHSDAPSGLVLWEGARRLSATGREAFRGISAAGVMGFFGGASRRSLFHINVRNAGIMNSFMRDDEDYMWGRRPRHYSPQDGYASG